ELGADVEGGARRGRRDLDADLDAAPAGRQQQARGEHGEEGETELAHRSFLEMVSTLNAPTPASDVDVDTAFTSPSRNSPHSLPGSRSVHSRFRSSTGRRHAS